MSEREKQLLATMVYEAVRFSSWAVGEGITPIAGEPARDPGEFLSDYVTGIDGDDYEGLAEVARDAIAGAPRAGTNGVPADMDDQAFALVDLIRSQNWKNGGALTIDRDEAKGRVMAFATDIMLAVVATQSAASTVEPEALNTAQQIARDVCRKAKGISDGLPAGDPEKLRWLHHSYDADEVAYLLDGHIGAAPTTSPEPDAVREAIEDAFCEAFSALDEDQRVHNGYVFAAAQVAEKLIASRPEHEGWQDISTAPQDGTRITAYQDKRGAFECWWHDDWPHAEHYWMDHADSEPDPSHWRPLIAPPIPRNDRGSPR